MACSEIQEVGRFTSDHSHKTERMTYGSFGKSPGHLLTLFNGHSGANHQDSHFHVIFSTAQLSSQSTGEGQSEDRLPKVTDLWSTDNTGHTRPRLLQTLGAAKYARHCAANPRPPPPTPVRPAGRPWTAEGWIALQKVGRVGNRMSPTWLPTLTPPSWVIRHHFRTRPTGKMFVVILEESQAASSICMLSL